MCLKTLQASEIPILDNNLHQISSKPDAEPSNFKVIGHRGSGMNSVSSKNSIRENSIMSFNNAAQFPIQYVEFDVQVTKDNHPIIFHDIFILNQESETRVAELSLRDFLSYSSNKPLLRKAHDGVITDWIVENDDSLCTLQEAFQKVEPRLGFNIELKFDDDIAYKDEEIVCTLEIILRCVWENCGARRVIFSTFHPDAVRLVKRMQSEYPVFFLTDGGTEFYSDERRNSLEAAMRLCEECGLDGIVSEVKAVLMKPEVVLEVKEIGVELITYGQLNNVEEVVYLQNLMGINGVIVDRVGEISEYVKDFMNGSEGDCDDKLPVL